MALVVVLVLLAVMMLVTITLSGRMQQQLGRTRSQQEYQQALWYSASAESLALSALSLSLKNEKRVHLAQPWAPALPSRRTGCPFLVGLWLAMRNGLSAASMNAGDGAPGWRWLRSCSAPSSMSRIYRFR